MVTELLKNIYRIEVPLPDNPLLLLNSYLIRGDDRSLIIDTGFNRPECREALMSAVEELHVDFDSTDIFLTHLHADHSGQIFSLKTDKNTAYAQELDAKIVNLLREESYWQHIYDAFYRAGLRIPMKDAIAGHPGVMWQNSGVVDFTYIEDGQVLKFGEYELRCVVTPGHSPGHTCLYDERNGILFAGDMILGDITPNLCYEMGLDDPLTEYVKSLRIVESLDIRHIFVGHREMTENAYSRIASLRVHHTNRCAEALQMLKLHGPMTSWDAAAHMTWDIDAKDWESFPLSQKWFATGEADAHFVFLNHNGKVRLHYDDDGVKIYEFVDDNIDGLIC